MEVEKPKQKSVVEPDLIPVQPLKLDSPVDGFLGSRFLQITVTLGLLIILFAVSFFLAVRGQVKEPSPEDLRYQPIPTAHIVVPQEASPIPNQRQTLCLANGGEWLADYNECENIKEDVCEANEGQYNSCESPCRHDPNAEMCIQLCVPVCTFGE